MTDDDLIRVEAALGVRLPAAYRQLVVPFRILAYVGNADTELWDDADKLIELNCAFRAGVTFVRPWPVHMFALGQDGGGSASAIDLRDPASPVWWADRGHLDAVGSGPGTSTLETWAEGYLAELRADLESNGIDPNGPPEARERAAEESARAGCGCLLLVVAIAVLVVLAAIALGVWLRR